LAVCRVLKTMLPVGENPPEIAFRLPHCLDVCCDSLELFFREAVNSLARDPAGIACFQDLGKFRQRESDTKRPLYYMYPLHCALWIQPVSRLGSLSFRKHTNLFIVPDRVRADPGCFGERPAMESVSDIPASQAVSTLEPIPESSGLQQSSSGLLLWELHIPISLTDPENG
jgi:hypothetical protein